MTEERNFEQEARQEGWRPQEDWDGDPDKWVDAQTFVERGEKINGILRSKVDRLESRLARQEQANKKFGQFHKQVLEKERQQAQKTIEQLETKLAKAIDEGDGQTFTQINRQISDLKQNIPTNDNKDEDELDPTAREWLNNNRWYETDRTLKLFADGLADQLQLQGFSGQAYFDELTRQVKEEFPQKFENPNRSREPGAGDNPPSGGGDSKKHTYANLPADAKAACDEFEQAGILSKEEYVKQYDWDDGEE